MAAMSILRGSDFSSEPPGTKAAAGLLPTLNRAELASVKPPWLTQLFLVKMAAVKRFVFRGIFLLLTLGIIFILIN